MDPHIRLLALDIDGTLLTSDRVVLEVSDNGPGFEEDNGTLVEKGIGLSNLLGRLEQLYGQNHRFEIDNKSEGGVRVRIEIPAESPED